MFSFLVLDFRYTVVAKKAETTLLVILLTKSFYPFWPPLYLWQKLISVHLWRTILHSFECFFIIMLCSYLICCHYVAYARLLFGPLPRYLCLIDSFGKNSIGVGGLLTADCLIVTRVRYFFHFLGLKVNNVSLLIIFFLQNFPRFFTS